ncbi:MAG: helix-turn-helix transcriptional regulator [bacterium]
MSNTYSKSLRILSLFERLNKGEFIKRKTAADYYGVSMKTIQRDIEELRLYLSVFYIEETAKIIYASDKEGYILIRDETNWLNCQEILGLSKILLESRAFSEDEMDSLLKKLVVQSPPQLRNHIEAVIRNEHFHYNPLEHGDLLLKKLWDLSQAVKKNKIIEIKYHKPNKFNSVIRKLEPLGLMFSEYYFYLIAQMHDKENDFKIPYRLDRIIEYNILDENYKIPYSDRFQEGEFRKRIQFMTPGKLLKIKFKFWGRSIQAVLDRLPTAKVINQQKESVYIVEAEVYGRGIKMWLLSQGQYIEVIEPEDFRQEMKDTLEDMVSVYK